MLTCHLCGFCLLRSISALLCSPSPSPSPNMVSLRRILSIDCTDRMPLQSSRRDLTKHHFLPIFSFVNPQRLSKARHGSCSHGRSHCSHERDVSSRAQFVFFGPASTWCEDDDVGRCTTKQPMVRNQDFHTEDSLVYKELCDSIRQLEAPPRYVQVLNPEQALGSDHARVEGELLEGGSKKKKVDQSFSIDVRGRPVSLRMLKRRDSQGRNFHKSSDAAVTSSNGEARDGVLLYDMASSVNSAFSSLVFMMESLQQHMLWLRTVVVSKADARLHAMMLKVHQEMQETFLWLFQQVFSRTPKLMLLTMILLVDFAVHSMGNHVSLGVMPMGEPPTCISEREIRAKAPTFEASSYELGATNPIHGSLTEPRLCEGGTGDKGVRAVKVGGSMDGEAMLVTSAERAAMSMGDELHGGLDDGSSCGGCTLHDGGDSEEHHMLAAIWQQAVLKEQNWMPLTEARHMLVAPVQAPALEADDYPCYDRTDLKYQHELRRDPSNPLLLANYAQFLQVVRRDYDRAELLYKRAVKADPVDGEVMGKYASFLWVAKEDIEAADEAYKAAMAVDPTNAYHAGSYAHFLWNSSLGQEDIASTTTLTYEEVSAFQP